MHKASLIICLLFLFICFPCHAFDVHGELSGEYVNQDWYYPNGFVWNIDLWVPLCDEKVIVGTKLTTYTSQFIDYEGWLPKGSNEGQYYSIYVTWNITDQLFITFTEECRHYFALSDKKGYDASGYRIKAGFTF